MLIGMTADVSKCRLSQCSHSRRLRINIPALSSSMKVFEYAVRLRTKSYDSHNMETSECHINYVCSAELMSHYALLKFNLLKPTSRVMHQQFNIQQLYVLPTLYLCVLYLSENKQRLVPLTA